MSTAEHLRRLLQRIDGKGYKAYKDIEGSYDFGPFSMHVDHVQGDPLTPFEPVLLRDVGGAKGGGDKETHESLQVGSLYLGFRSILSFQQLRNELSLCVTASTQNQSWYALRKIQ